MKPSTSVYIVHKQLRRRQPLVHMLACSEYFPVRVVRVLCISQTSFPLSLNCMNVQEKILCMLC